jgi:hypothetical protein
MRPARFAKPRRRLDDDDLCDDDDAIGKLTAKTAKVDSRPVVPFQQDVRMDPDGRLAPGAPVYSPFLRREEDLVLE